MMKVVLMMTIFNILVITIITSHRHLIKSFLFQPIPSLSPWHTHSGLQAKTRSDGKKGRAEANRRRWFSTQEERHGPIHRRWIPLSDSRDTNEDAQEVLEIPEMPTTPPGAATGGSMGEQEAEPPRKIQPWRELLKTKDGWRSILYDPDPNAGIANFINLYKMGMVCYWFYHINGNIIILFNQQ
jgi:hypothetical protein